MGRCKRICDLCGAEKPEFTVTSKHLGYMLKDLKEFVTETDHITKHICTDCFLKIFRKPEENPTSKPELMKIDTISAEDLRVDKDMSHKLRDAVLKQHSNKRPFNNCNELIEYWCVNYEGVAEQHIKSFVKQMMPSIWVKSKAYGTDNLITAFDNDNESIGGSCVFIQDMWVDMKELFDNFTFLDGSLCGVEE